jgi:hypothetical protein
VFVLHQALFAASIALLAALATGLVVRRKLGISVVFSIYVASAAGFSIFMFGFPGSVTPEFYVVKQGIYDCLLFSLALELSYKTFAAFRGIADRARAFLAAAVVISSVAIFVLTPPDLEYSSLGRYQPGITTAGLWCLTFVALLIVWYQIPVPSFTRAIILAYVPYLVVFVICLDLIARRGWQIISNINVVNAAAYDLAIGYLAVSAWRKD